MVQWCWLLNQCSCRDSRSRIRCLVGQQRQEFNIHQQSLNKCSQHQYCNIDFSAERYSIGRTSRKKATHVAVCILQSINYAKRKSSVCYLIDCTHHQLHWCRCFWSCEPLEWSQDWRLQQDSTNDREAVLHYCNVSACRTCLQSWWSLHATTQSKNVRQCFVPVGLHQMQQTFGKRHKCHEHLLSGRSQTAACQLDSLMSDAISWYCSICSWQLPVRQLFSLRCCQLVRYCHTQSQSDTAFEVYSSLLRPICIRSHLKIKTSRMAMNQWLGSSTTISSI